MFKTPLKLLLAGAVAMPVFIAPDLAFAGGKHHKGGHHKGGHHYKGGHYKGGHYGGRYKGRHHGGHYKKRYGYGYGGGYYYGGHYKKHHYKPYYGGGYYYGGRHKGHHGHGNAAAYAGLAILGAALGYAIHESNKDDNQYQGGYAQPNSGYVTQQAPRVIVIPQEGQYSQNNAAPNVQGGFDFSQCQETREYQTTILVEGQEQLAYGTACLMPNGDWVAGPMQIGR